MGSRMSVTLTVFLLAGTGPLVGGCGDQMTGPGQGPELPREPAPRPPLVLPPGLSGTLFLGDGPLQAMDMRTGQLRTIPMGGIRVGDLHGAPGGQELVFNRIFDRIICSPGFLGSCNPAVTVDSIRPWRIGVDGSGLAPFAHCAPGQSVALAFTADARTACLSQTRIDNRWFTAIHVDNQPVSTIQGVKIQQEHGFASSPDGSFFVVSRADLPPTLSSIAGNSFYRIALGDTTTTLLISGLGGGLRLPVFSPSGSLIAFHHFSIDGRLPGIDGTWVVTADGSNPRQVTKSYSGGLTWSPDGKWLVAGTKIVRADGTDEAQILEDGSWRSMIWVP